MIGTKMNFQPYDTRDTITYHMDNDNDIKNSTLLGEKCCPVKTNVRWRALIPHIGGREASCY